MEMTDVTVGKVDEERNRAMIKHGRLTDDVVRACAILGREWGEAMNEALLLTAPAGSMRAEVIRSKHARNLYDELAQVAATATLIMEAIEGRM